MPTTTENKQTPLPSGLRAMADRIIQAEKGDHSWTLMHRFNLCHDLLDQADNPDALALLFVWLRFSDLRQLDWQRNYNTKPRELSHAQQRLTLRLASLYRDRSPEEREIIRLMLSTMGRGAAGGKGQQIRDDILHIMHRHKVKEVSGHFLEEWHQKLHNNTTPDDIVICQAYLEFLRSNGNLDTFYQTLEQGGVSRERLRSFERPIVTDPQFVPHLRDGLIHDFENYLNLLQSIHSAKDLASAIAEARDCLDDALSREADQLYATRDEADIPLLDRVKGITALRIALQKAINQADGNECRRDLLYLDLALEEFLRTVVERDLHKEPPPELLEALIEMLIQNVNLYHPDPELTICLDLIATVKDRGQHSPEDRALHFIAANERINNVLASFADYYTGLLQEKAEYLGHGFEAEDWVINLFSQEIIRGGAAFLLSILSSQISPALRRKAGLGSWQIISRGAAAGRVRVANLMDLQDIKLSEPTIVVSDRLSGDEEIIDNLNGVVTPVNVDVLSHVAVRARNAGVFFACSSEPKAIEALKSLEGRQVNLSITSSGEVAFEEMAGKPGREQQPTQVPEDRPPLQTVDAGAFAVGLPNFEREIVGGKAYHLKRLKNALPERIGLPASVAIPFGVCEKVLALEENIALKAEYDRLVSDVEQDPPGILTRLRSLLTELALPAALLDQLETVMNEQGLAFPDNRENVKERIKQVWASKWNDRAYYSRKKYRINHQDLLMSVLIQQTIPAEYAFVLHTANPFSGRDDEVYGEVVVGLGETLCSGAYQGRALSFVCGKKPGARPRLQFYPSKGRALFGGGLIFRSDSNGEDLQDYAGAGLYDSLPLEPPEERLVDYNDVDLLWQEEARNTFFRELTDVGLEVEKAMDGAPQDIEGAYADGRLYVVQTRAQVGLSSEDSAGRPEEVFSPEPAEPCLRIGNQTAYAAAHFNDPFEFAVNNSFNAFEWFPDKKEDGAGWDIHELSGEQREAIRTTAAANDILLSVHAPWWANPLTEEGAALLLEHLDFAGSIGAVVFNLHFHTDQGLDLFLEKLEPIIRAARAADLKLAVENTPATTPQDCNAFFALLRDKGMDGPDVGLCFDLGHANLCEATRNDYVGYLKALAPHVPILHAHFHENFGEADNHLPLFTGPAKDNPAGLRMVMEHLLARDFTGAVILEQWPDPPSLLVAARRGLLEFCPPPPLRSGSKKKQDKKKTVSRDKRQDVFDPDTAAFVSLDQSSKSWREKLNALADLLQSEAWHYSLHQLALLAIYLRFLGTGQINCTEDGRHFRPSHHAGLSEKIFRRLIARTPDEHRFMLRKIIPWLPSFAAPFKRSEPLTRIRDIAHRNDIPKELKKEIKQRLQNKLHRCAGPEDLRTAEDILERLHREKEFYSSEFLREFEIFYRELQEFFNAQSLEYQLKTLVREDEELAEAADAFLEAKGAPDRSTASLLGELRILTGLRRQLRQRHRAVRQDHTALFRLLLCDVALEDYAFTAASTTINTLGRTRAGSLPETLSLAGLLTENIGLAGVEPGECQALHHELTALRETGSTGGRDFLLRLKACLERGRRLAETYSRRISLLLTGRAEALGKALNLPEPAIQQYTEGEIRGNLVFQLSKVADAIIHYTNQTLKISDQDVLVPGTATGTLVRAGRLGDIGAPDGACLILLEKAAGDEDIPGQVRGIILLHDLPHLSHLAIRARQEGVVLVTAPANSPFFQTPEVAAELYTLSADYRGVTLNPVQEEAGEQKRIPQKARKTPAISTEPFAGRYTLEQGDLTAANAGAKADGVRRLSQLAESDPGLFSVPKALAIPFGVMEKAIDDTGCRERYQQLIHRLNRAGGNFRGAENDLKELITGLNLPPEINRTARKRFGRDILLMVRSSANCEDLENMAGAGLYDSLPDIPVNDLPDAILSVWSSLWNRRAVSSREKTGIPHEMARMAVLLQPCLDPDYSFVIHTTNPLTGKNDELYLEIAAGRGEILASAAARGTPYRIRVNKKNGRATLLSYANYSMRLQAGGPLVNDYSKIGLTVDAAYRKQLIARLAKAAKAVEDFWGRPQDIEGAVVGEAIHLVQTRPQVGID